MRRFDTDNGSTVTAREFGSDGTEFVTFTADGDVISTVRAYGAEADGLIELLRSR